MALMLYNTLTKKKEEFKPEEPKVEVDPTEMGDNFKK